MSDREINQDVIRRILGNFTNVTAREIAAIGGFSNIGRLQDVLASMVGKGVLVREAEPVEEGTGRTNTCIWRYSLATARTEARIKQSIAYDPTPAHRAEGRALWASAAVLLLLLFSSSIAQAQTAPIITDPATAEIAFVNVDLRVVSFLCKVGPNNTQNGAWDAVPGVACGNLTTPDTASTEHTWPLPPDLPDGNYLAAVNACAPGALGCSGYTEAIPFTVARGGTPPPPPPPPPPPTGVQKPIMVTVRQRASASATPSDARFGVRAFPAGAIVSKTLIASPSTANTEIKFEVPFPDLGRATLCITSSDGQLHCHLVSWLLPLILIAEKQ